MISRLPLLKDPVKYTGLYIFDFGDHASVGYTAEEILWLLADERYAQGDVYKIYRANSDGTLELKLARPEGWSRLTGLVFWFDNRQAALDEIVKIESMTADNRPPGEFELLSVELIPGDDQNEFEYGADFHFAMVIRYSLELDDAMANWLLKNEYCGGITVDGGEKVVAWVIKNGTELSSEKFGADSFRNSRTKDAVFNSIDQPIQR